MSKKIFLRISYCYVVSFITSLNDSFAPTCIRSIISVARGAHLFTVRKAHSAKARSVGIYNSLHSFYFSNYNRINRTKTLTETAFNVILMVGRFKALN